MCFLMEIPSDSKEFACNAGDPDMISGSGRLLGEGNGYSSILAWRIPWTEEAGRLQSLGLQRAGYDWAANTFTLTKLSYKNQQPLNPNLLWTTLLASWFLLLSSVIYGDDPKSLTWGAGRFLYSFGIGVLTRFFQLFSPKHHFTPITTLLLQGFPSNVLLHCLPAIWISIKDQETRSGKSRRTGTRVTGLWNVK